MRIPGGSHFTIRGRAEDIAAWFRMVVMLLFVLSGCASEEAITAQNQMAVHTRMSETIFLDPVAPDQRTIYVGVRNTSDFPGIDVKAQLVHALRKRGYTLVDDPDIARFELQVNVLQAGRIRRSRQNPSLMRGSVPGGLVSTYIGNIPTGLFSQIMGGDVTFAVITDVRLAERPGSGLPVQQLIRTSRESAAVSADPVSGTATNVVNSNARYQESGEASAFRIYNVQDVAYVDQAGLTVDKVIPILTAHIASSLANLFE
ncbi:complement resistance protein TraT [Acetobacter oeni]|uniref:Conjugative transfer: surface exclusion n=1 Tax=Acetobacter oeni TaxID=304077 RepID=A0A511XGG1_9PROT|nr:complement resistance protein TraT [Acetobacter oeni]MBB3881794.1 hypothetical protein [Acetobacter oeni]NHO17404.1 hypothetical protein [Acetobacter oeni]GBR02061.1 TraT complement resistance protein precursor [Acetobacter oeni LMG 21952]GEN62032.1 conjugative transfer: surface exclusion [Acetobacter oeni]